MIYVRLVHLLDEQKRQELMIIYDENTASTGLTAAELRKGRRSIRPVAGDRKRPHREGTEEDRN